MTSRIQRVLFPIAFCALATGAWLASRPSAQVPTLQVGSQRVAKTRTAPAESDAPPRLFAPPAAEELAAAARERHRRRQ